MLSSRAAFSGAGGVRFGWLSNMPASTFTGRNIVRPVCTQIGGHCVSRAGGVSYAANATSFPTFVKCARKKLVTLSDEISNLDIRRISINETDSSLEISVSNAECTEVTGRLLLSRHYEYEQIWYSSPIRGSIYFDYASGWHSTRTREFLDQVLRADIAELLSH